MSDAQDQVREQIAYWQTKRAEAVETLKAADAILPALEAGLRAATVTVAAPASTAQPAAAATPAPSAAPPGTTELRRSHEVETAVRAIVEFLPRVFTQKHVEENLLAVGHSVNRSTLRSALLSMSNRKDGFSLTRPGKGRVATVFQRVNAEGT